LNPERDDAAPDDLAEAHALILQQRKSWPRPRPRRVHRARGDDRPSEADDRQAPARAVRPVGGARAEGPRPARAAARELEADASEAAVTTEATTAGSAVVQSFTRRRPGGRPAGICRASGWSFRRLRLLACGGKLAKLGEDVTETLEVIRASGRCPTVRRSSLSVLREITSRRRRSPDRAGAGRGEPARDDPLCQVRQHQPLNRQSDVYGREGSRWTSRRSPTGWAPAPPRWRRWSS